MKAQRFLIAAAAVTALSACGMFGGMGSDKSGNGNGSTSGSRSDTGAGNDAVAECKGLTGTALRDCLDRQGLNRAREPGRY